MEKIARAVQPKYAYWKEIEREMVGTGGRVCTIGWGAEHGRERRRRPRRERVKEKRPTRRQQRFYSRTRHV